MKRKCVEDGKMVSTNALMAGDGISQLQEEQCGFRHHPRPLEELLEPSCNPGYITSLPMRAFLNMPQESVFLFLGDSGPQLSWEQRPYHHTSALT